MKPGTASESATTPEPAKPKRKVRAGRLLSGASGLAAGFFSVGVEIARNFAYGAQKSDIYGYSYALFAVGLALIPFLAWRGWNAWLRATWLTCMVMTAYFGVNYYSAEILAKVSAAKKVTGEYERAVAAADEAEHDRAAAQAEADAIGENRPSSALKAAYAAAEAQYEREKKVCLTECKAAKESMKALAAALPLAEAREQAQARADEARERRDTARAQAGIGPADATPLATLLAMQTGGNAQDYAAGMDIGEPIAMVLGMLLFASLIHPSLGAIREGLGMQEEVVRQPTGLVIVASPKAAEQRRLAAPAKPVKRVRKPATPEDRIMLFVEEKLRPGEGETFGGEMGEAFTEWWRVKFPGVTMPSQNLLAKVLTEQAGIVKERRGGRTRYAASLVA